MCAGARVRRIRVLCAVRMRAACLCGGALAFCGADPTPPDHPYLAATLSHPLKPPTRHRWLIPLAT